MTWPDPVSALPLGDGRHASAVDRPATIDALRQAVSTRVAEGLAIYPQGGCTALDYGGTPRIPGIALDTRSLDRVIDYPAADMTVTVEAGITLAALQAVLAAEGQRLLVDAPRSEIATVGAVFATNTSGPRRFGAGRPRDQVIGVSFVTSAGVTVKGGGRVVKNVAGYDFPRLLTGSLGTLGVIAQLTLKVRPRPEASAIVWATLAQITDVLTALRDLNTSATRPMAVELLNRPAARTVGEPLGLPVDEFVLAVGFEDNAQSVAWQIDRLRRELGKPDAAVLDGPPAASAWTALTDFQAAELGPVTVVANIVPSKAAAFVCGLDPSHWSAQAHAGNGIVRAHWVGTPDLDAVAPEVDLMRSMAVSDGGNLVLSRCPADWKSRLRVWGQSRPDWLLAERIKNALDPIGMMNPGKFVGRI